MFDLKRMVLKAVYIYFFPLPRIQKSGPRWWSRTLQRQGSSLATEPSLSMPRMSGGWSPPTWKSRPQASPGRPSRKQPERRRRCDEVPGVASLPTKSHLCIFTFPLLSAYLCPNTCSRDLSVTVVQRWPRPVNPSWIPDRLFPLSAAQCSNSISFVSFRLNMLHKKKKSLWNNAFVFFINVILQTHRSF